MPKRKDKNKPKSVTSSDDVNDITTDDKTVEHKTIPIHQYSDWFMYEYKDKFYRYGGCIAIPRIDDESEQEVLKPFKHAYMKTYVRRKFDLLTEGKVSAIAEDVLHRADLPFRRITMLCHAPTVTRELQLISEPGFHEVSGIYYAPDPSIAGNIFSTNAGRKQAEDGLALIRELLTDFPFVSDDDKNIFVAFMLTMFLRPAINAVIPGLMLNGNGQSVGKTLLIDLMSLIVFGENAATTSVPKDEKEWQTRLDGIIMKGSPFHVIDNVVGTLRSSNLASVLTSRHRECRVLGKSDMPTLPVNTMFAFNGNNVELDSDMSNRMIICKMQHPDAANRDQQAFKIQARYGYYPDELVERERVKYLQACLDIICGWINDGAPLRPKTSLAKYGKWESVVGGLMDWLVPNEKFLCSHKMKSAAADTERESTILFLETIMENFPKCSKEPITAADIRAKIYTPWEPGQSRDNDLRDALPAALNGKDDVRFVIRLGQWLKNTSTRIYDGIQVECRYDSHKKINRFLFKRVKRSNAVGDFEDALSEPEPEHQKEPIPIKRSSRIQEIRDKPKLVAKTG